MMQVADGVDGRHASCPGCQHVADQGHVVICQLCCRLVGVCGCWGGGIGVDNGVRTPCFFADCNDWGYVNSPAKTVDTFVCSGGGPAGGIIIGIAVTPAFVTITLAFVSRCSVSPVVDVLPSGACVFFKLTMLLLETLSHSSLLLSLLSLLLLS